MCGKEVLFLHFFRLVLRLHLPSRRCFILSAGLLRTLFFRADFIAVCCQNIFSKLLFHDSARSNLLLPSAIRSNEAGWLDLGPHNQLQT